MTNETILHKTLTNEATSSAQSELFDPAGTQPGGENSRLRWLKMATGAVDRAGDQLVLAGMDATNFRNNPQFLWQHGASGAQINTIGRVKILRIVADALFALVEYADVNPLAEQIYQLDLAGLLPANSIGFRPIEWEANETGGFTFTKWELIECSKVELPMNPEAVDSLRTENEEWRTESTSTSIEQAADWLLS
jgi:hypothetical protein